MSDANDPDDVRLVVNGQEFGGWKEVEITAGIERQVRDFKLAVTDKWPGQTDIPRRISRDDICQVFIGKDQLLNGYVDATPISYDATSLTVGVNGRSKTRDLVDCSAINSPGSWQSASLERIAGDMAAEYGISVVSEVSTGAPLAHAIEQGESVFESVDRMLKLRQLLATDDAQGRLVFIEIGSAGKASTALKYGDNVLTCSAPLDYKDVYSEIICKGQRAGNDDDFGDAVAGESASLKDATAIRRRVLLIKSNGQTDTGTAADRVKYEMSHRKAKALETVYSVQGWRQANGELWKANQLVQVIDPVVGFNLEMVIAEVTYRFNAKGRIALLQVGPVDGYVNNASKKSAKAKKAAGSGDGGGDWADVKPADEKSPAVRSAGKVPKGGEWADIKASR